MKHRPNLSQLLAGQTARSYDVYTHSYVEGIILDVEDSPYVGASILHRVVFQPFNSLTPVKDDILFSYGILLDGVWVDAYRGAVALSNPVRGMRPHLHRLDSIAALGKAKDNHVPSDKSSDELYEEARGIFY